VLIYSYKAWYACALWAIDISDKTDLLLDLSMLYKQQKQTTNISKNVETYLKNYENISTENNSSFCFVMFGNSRR
jgi:hypothetical protein